MNKSDLADYPEYYQKYVRLVEEEDLNMALVESLQEISTFFSSLPEEKMNHRYQPDKWSIKEVLAHLIDSERIMGYRALCFARNDLSELSGFDQESYVKNSNANQRDITELVKDYSSARRANIQLFQSFEDKMLLKKGVANKYEVSVLLIGFMMVGHGYHHLNIVKQRYLQP
jgi:hypothetical protein